MVVEGLGDGASKRLPRGLVLLGNGEAGGISPAADRHAELGALVKQRAELVHGHERLVCLRGVRVEQSAGGERGDHVRDVSRLGLGDRGRVPLVVVDSEAVPRGGGRSGGDSSWYMHGLYFVD